MNQKGAIENGMYDNYNADEVFFTFIGALSVFLGILLIISLILGLIIYIISSLILFNTAKTNGLNNVAFLGWIPIVKTYLYFALGSTKQTLEEIRKDAIIWTIVYFSLFFVLFIIAFFIPFIDVLALLAILVIIFYFMYRLFYRWSGESGMAVLLLVISIMTGGIFYYVYGLMKMNKPFVAQ